MLALLAGQSIASVHLNMLLLLLLAGWLEHGAEGSLACIAAGCRMQDAPVRGCWRLPCMRHDRRAPAHLYSDICVTAYRKAVSQFFTSRPVVPNG